MMVIFAEITKSECIIETVVRDVDPLRNSPRTYDYLSSPDCCDLYGKGPKYINRFRV